VELRHLRYLVAVVDEGSISGAAARLRVAQPSLSRQLGTLEREVGVPLLRRTPAGAIPTSAGSELARRARRLLKAADAAGEAARAAAAAEGTHLRVGILTYVRGRDVDALFEDVTGSVPGLVIEYRPTMHDFDRMDEVRDGVLDVAFLRRERVDGPGLSLAVLRREEMVVALPETHPLADLAAVPLAALDGEPFVFYPREDDPEWYDHVFGSLRSAGARPSVILEGEHAFDTLPHVADGRASTMISASLADTVTFRGVAFRPLTTDGPRPVLPMSVTWRTDDDRAAVMAVRRAARAREIGPSPSPS